eukprot:GHVT01089852.1.p1 GENE.GHVT01089852.1~~GHVT01089852.1.p1  ORF type:complete len:183 (-),score=34.14 GHVT01089852.1:835-1383(-)
MVAFTCDVCQDVVKKNKIESHCMHGACQGAWNFTCLDCGEVFQGFSYKAHNQCITEEDKYNGCFARKRNGGQPNVVSPCPRDLPPPQEPSSAGLDKSPAAPSKPSPPPQAPRAPPAAPTPRPKLQPNSKSTPKAQKLTWKGSWKATIDAALRQAPSHKLHWKNLVKLVSEMLQVSWRFHQLI